MITTTLNRIALADCLPDESWVRLLKKLGKTQADDEPLPFSLIVEINGLDYAILCFEAEPQYEKEIQLFSLWCARRVQHLMTDPSSITALDVTERYANGGVTKTTLEQAMDAAWAAVCAGPPPRASAAWAARAALSVVDFAAAFIPCSMPSYVMPTHVARAARAARAAQGAAAAELTWTTAAAHRAAAFELVEQTEEFLRIVNETEART